MKHGRTKLAWKWYVAVRKEIGKIWSQENYYNFFYLSVGNRSYNSVLHWKRSAPSTTEKWESSFPFQIIFVGLVKTTVSTQSWSIKIPQDSQQCTRKPRISSDALWKYRISSRTGWYWGRWIWRNWSRLTYTLSQTGRETLEHWRLKEGKPKNYLCKSNSCQLMITQLLRNCKDSIQSINQSINFNSNSRKH